MRFLSYQCFVAQCGMCQMSKEVKFNDALGNPVDNENDTFLL